MEGLINMTTLSFVNCMLHYQRRSSKNTSVESLNKILLPNKYIILDLSVALRYQLYREARSLLLRLAIIAESCKSSPVLYLSESGKCPPELILNITFLGLKKRFGLLCFGNGFCIFPSMSSSLFSTAGLSNSQPTHW